jgi:hypothetical protein
MIYKATPDYITMFLLDITVFLPPFLLTWAALTYDMMTALFGGLLLIFFYIVVVLPLLHASYATTKDALVVRFWTTKIYPYKEIRSAQVVGGIHNFALLGFGYYCNNFRSRVFISSKGETFVLSPNTPNALVRDLKERIG